MNIREMDFEDIDEVLEIEEEVFRDPWSKNLFEQELKNSLAYYFVADIDEKIIGYAGAWFVADEGQIMNIGVKKEFWGQGIGTLLMKKIIEISEEKNINSIFLEVRTSNKSAQKVYTNLGFKEIGIRKNYYQDNKEDAIIMQRERE